MHTNLDTQYLDTDIDTRTGAQKHTSLLLALAYSLFVCFMSIDAYPKR